MEEGSKRRLIGATVVVVLLVIFVPMVIDKDRKPPAPPPLSEAAPKDQPRPEMDAEFRQPGNQSALATITELPPPDLLTPSERGLAGTGNPSRVDMPVTKPVPTKPSEGLKTKEAAKPLTKEVPKEGSKETKKEVSSDVAKDKQAPKPADSGPKKTGTGWVFQVASLTERAKADEMAGNLKSKGFPAFVEAAEVNGKTYFRVRVGPRQERKDIDTLAAAVRDKTGQSGQVQRY